MAKNKKPSGEHKVPRVNVAVPEPWHAVLRKIAAAKKQPVLYALIDLIAQEAAQHEITELPTPPWEGTDGR